MIAHLFTCDDGEWVALVYEDVDGASPRLPWEAAELTRVLAAMGDLADGLTPSPVDAPAAPATLGNLFGGWRELAYTGAGTGLGDWALSHLSRLIDMEDGAECFWLPLETAHILQSGQGALLGRLYD